MVEVYKTEEEQFEALKRWLRENGRQLLLGVLTAAVAAFGVYSWQQRQIHQREAASVMYENLLQSVRQLETQSDSEKIATARHHADTLKKDFENSSYAQFAALFNAKLAVQQNDLPRAEAELRWVLEHKPSPEIKAITQLRLARVLHAKGEGDAALALLEEKNAGSYAAAFMQVRGDIELARGNADAAKTAYQKARDLERAMTTPVNDPLLEMKLRDLQPEEKAAEQGA
jgi:predicted negative regulator of RcsB-dependent stress response